MTALSAADGAAIPQAPAGIVSRRQAWFAVSAGAIGGFMALLDTSIANSALPVIQGEIGATQSEGTWIGTAYLMTEVIILPLIAWLERIMGMRRLILISATVFTLFSVVCGMATSLGWMIFGRLGQGLSGGVLFPTAYTMVARFLPADEQSKGIAIISVPILLAPIIGPLLGGWLTETYSWHLAFLINVPVCAVLILLIIFAVPPSEGDPREFANADWLGIVGMTTGLGALTVMLEEGYREQWFESPLIWKLAILSFFGFVMVGIGQVRSARPVLKLALLKDRVCLASTLILIIMGTVMFATLFSAPQFLVTIAGYNAYQAGQVTLVTGLVSCISMLFYPLIMKYSDIRVTVIVSAISLALSAYLCSALTADDAGEAFRLSLGLFALGLSMIAIPLQQVTIARVALPDVSEINSITTVARNLGGSIGLAALASFQGERIEVHHWQLHESVNANRPDVWEALSGYADFVGGGGPNLETAYRLLDMQIMRDALVMTFNDSYFVMAIVSLTIIPLALFLEPMKPGQDRVAALH